MPGEGRSTGRRGARGVIRCDEEPGPVEAVRQLLSKLNLDAMAMHSRASVPSFVCSGGGSNSAPAHRDPYAGLVACVHT